MASLPVTEGRWAVKQDCKPLLAIALGSLAAAIWPRRWDRQLLDWRFNSFCRSHPSTISDLAVAMQSLLGPELSKEEANRAARDYFRISKEIGWHRIRSIWSADVRASDLRNNPIRIDGLEHIEAGLALGRGVVLWNPFFGGYVLPKAALFQAGIRSWHLSRADHAAPSRSWLGLKVVGGLFKRAEDRYLSKRVIMPLDGSLTYMRDLMALLAANQVVSISGELKSNRQNQTAPLFHWEEEFATGAPSLAWKQNSVLLTSYVIREGPFRFRMIIEPPILAARGPDRHKFVENAVAEFSARIESHVRQYPEAWERWEDGDIRSRLSALSPLHEN